MTLTPALAGSARGRERVTHEVRLDPVLDELLWVDHERTVFATPETPTVKLPAVGDGVLLGRKAELGDLVRRDGLPDDELRGPTERRPSIDLRGLAIVSRRTHWREVRLDVWRHPVHGAQEIIGYVGDAENPSLTRLLARHEVKAERRRIAARQGG